MKTTEPINEKYVDMPEVWQGEPNPIPFMGTLIVIDGLPF